MLPVAIATTGAGMRLAIRIDAVGSLILAARPPVGSPRMLTSILLGACPLLARLLPLTLLTLLAGLLLTRLLLAGLLLLLACAGATLTSAAATSSLLTAAL